MNPFLLTTDRLTLRRLTTGDAPFMLALHTSPDWLKYIGDRGVRNEDDARQYIENGALISYEKYGYGPYAIQLIDDENVLGVCGLFKRDNLEDPDLGFSFLPEHTGKGYGFEASSALMAYAVQNWQIKRLLAITVPYNQPSIGLLQKLGFRLERTTRLADDAEELLVYGWMV
ncbi:MAG TPA: GNAT family N-acetyltransferase [Flavilitoribacter sp.]|nr:GNAT family N-acetyltransferase [Flavilitoribacter sp.]HMQ89093.1 GNAT family N-acetyltransferase [Flavilitoribacter sp.]